MELSDLKIISLSIFVTPKQIHDLPFANDVADLLGRIGGGAGGFPFRRFPGVDPVLGPEMKSTGEVMGESLTFGNAFAT